MSENVALEIYSLRTRQCQPRAVGPVAIIRFSISSFYPILRLSAIIVSRKDYYYYLVIGDVVVVVVKSNQQ